MKFSSDKELESRVGRICLVFARVEQEAGRVVTAAQGNWDVAMSTDYLVYSSSSSVLDDCLKSVVAAYPEVSPEVLDLRTRLKDLKNSRDTWAHSADITDLFLMMQEKGRQAMSDHEAGIGALLNGKMRGHTAKLRDEDVEGYCVKASDVGDLATSIGDRLAELAGSNPRTVALPKPVRRR